MEKLSTQDVDFAKRFETIVDARREADSDVAGVVTDILRTVKSEGDAALADYTARFDGYALAQDHDWLITKDQCAKAYDALDSDLRDALDLRNHF